MKEFNRGILRSFCKDTNKVLSHFYGFSLEVTVKCIPSLSSPTTLWSNFPKCHSGQRMMDTFLIIIGPSYWHSPLITVSRTAELSPLYEDNILRSKEESRGMWLIPHPREGWISFYWHVIVSLVVFEFEESWCTSDLCSFSNPRRKGWWEAFCPIQISQRCNCRVGDSKSGTSDKVTEQTATTNNPGPGSALAQLFCLLSTMRTQGQKRKSRKWARDARNHRDVCVPWLVRDGGTLLRADLRMTFVCCA